MIIAELYPRDAEDGSWGWRLVEEENGEIVATDGNQGFRDEWDAQRAVSDLWYKAANSLRIDIVDS